MKSARVRERNEMSAHLAELATLAFRQGNSSKALDILRQVRRINASHFYSDETMYLHGLFLAGKTPEESEAAVAAIIDGKRPPSSLPGMVAKMQSRALGSAEREDGEQRAFDCGNATAFGLVLDLLGVKL